MLTKKQAVKSFKEAIPLSENKFPDIHAKRQAWVVFADLLQRDNLITESQATRWTNPFPIV